MEKQPGNQPCPEILRGTCFCHTITTNSVELLLNLLWLAASVILGVILLKSRGRREAMSQEYVHPRSTVWISYLILVVMLLPVISMTDDMMTMVAPSDSDRIARRCEGFVSGHAPAPFHRIHETLFFPARDVSLPPVLAASTLESVQVLHCSYCFYRQSTQGRAPPRSA